MTSFLSPPADRRRAAQFLLALMGDGGPDEAAAVVDDPGAMLGELQLRGLLEEPESSGPADAVTDYQPQWCPLASMVSGR